MAKTRFLDTIGSDCQVEVVMMHGPKGEEFKAWLDELFPEENMWERTRRETICMCMQVMPDADEKRIERVLDVMDEVSARFGRERAEEYRRGRDDTDDRREDNGELQGQAEAGERMNEEERRALETAARYIHNARRMMLYADRALEEIGDTDAVKRDRELISSMHMQATILEHRLEQRALGREWDP